jgi:predicted dinucleotide-binding enzyme
MTTAIIGTGGIGSIIARRFASRGETLRKSGRKMAPIRSAELFANASPSVAPSW